MFNRAIAANVLAACALVAILATATACGGAGNKSGSAATTTGQVTVTQAVTDTYQRFFNGSTPAQEKIALLENGQAFAATINAQAGSSLAKSTTATVSTVASSDTDRADVTFTVLSNGQPALANQAGSAVYLNGGWKVTAATFCTLLTLEGNPPPVCATATPTTAAPVPTS